MFRTIVNYGTKIESCAFWHDAFTEEQLDYLQGIAKNNTLPGLVGGANNNGEVRRSEVSWLNDDSNHSWVFDRIAHVVSTLNAEYFQFNLGHFSEPVQLSNYSEHNNGTYHWHQDFGSIGPYRKLSLVLQLSDPREYEGGELQLLTEKKETTIAKQRGLITVFPSWTLHRVTPTTRGNRQSMVVWVSGEPFR